MFTGTLTHTSRSRCSHALTTIVVAGVLLAISHVATPAAQADIFEDFQSYTPGTFPSPAWLDVGLIDPTPPNPPNPSVTIESTLDAFGNPTLAMSVPDALAESQGIYRRVGVATHYTVGADIRVDQYCDNPRWEPSDWPMEISVARYIHGVDPAHIPQAALYVSSFAKEWRLWIDGIDSLNVDISLGLPADLGRWYTVQLDIDAINGVFHSTIIDTLTSATLVDRIDTVDGWTPTDGRFNMLLACDGELGDNTIGNMAVIDNITFIPAPAAALILLVPMFAGRRRRYG